MLLLLTAAFLFRLQGIWFGYPLSVHPDEPLIVNAALHMVRTGNLNPHFFEYPTLFIYLQALLYAAITFLERLFSPFPTSAMPEIEFYVCGRVLNVVLSTATIYATYEIGRRVINAWAGLAAACFISASNLHVANSFTITVDSSVALWSSLSALMAVMIYTGGEKRWYYVASGIFAGFAVASKYTAFPAVLPMIIAHLYQARQDRHWINMNIVIGLFAAPCAFLLTTPYALLDSKSFIKAIMLQGHHYGTGHPGAESLTNSSYALYFNYLFTKGFGIVPGILAVTGMSFLLAEDRWKALMLLGFPLFFFLFVGAYKVFFSRNIVATIPFLSLFSGLSIYVIADWCRRRLLPSAGHVWRSAVIFAVGLVLVFISTYSQVVYAHQTIQEMTLPDTRWVGLLWIQENLPPGAHIGREHYTPPVEKYTDKYSVSDMGYFPFAKKKEIIEKIRTFDFMVVSSGDYGRFVDHPDIYPSQAQAYENFFAGNELVKEFVPDGKTLGGPTIRIYRIKR